MNRSVLVTGGFDPLHSGHIAYFKAAKNLGDRFNCWPKFRRMA